MWDSGLEARLMVLIRAYQTAAREVREVRKDLPMVPLFTPDMVDWNWVVSLSEEEIRSRVFERAYTCATGDTEQPPMSRWTDLRARLTEWKDEVLNDAKVGKIA